MKEDILKDDLPPMSEDSHGVLAIGPVKTPKELEAAYGGHLLIRPIPFSVIQDDGTDKLMNGDEFGGATTVEEANVYRDVQKALGEDK